jgi:hypothetical protein
MRSMRRRRRCWHLLDGHGRSAWKPSAGHVWNAECRRGRRRRWWVERCRRRAAAGVSGSARPVRATRELGRLCHRAGRSQLSSLRFVSGHHGSARGRATPTPQPCRCDRALAALTREIRSAPCRVAQPRILVGNEEISEIRAMLNRSRPRERERDGPVFSAMRSCVGVALDSSRTQPAQWRRDLRAARVPAGALTSEAGA